MGLQNIGNIFNRFFHMLAILQARMSSSRLPGKMMMNIKGEILLQRVINRVSQARKISKIIVATSDHISDKPIVDFCEKLQVLCYKGYLEDVAGRFKQLVISEEAKAFVRINGDSPLIDPELIDRAVGYFELGNCDLVTNVFPRTFPKGQSVEVLLSKTFIKAVKSFTTNEQHEHVTRIYYENPYSFRITNFTSGGEYGNINMSVDTIEDKIKLEEIILSLEGNQEGWETLVKVYQK